MSQPSPEQLADLRRRGYGFGARMLRDSIAWRLQVDLNLCPCDRTRAALFDGLMDGARAAVEAGRREWKEQGTVPTKVAPGLGKVSGAIVQAATRFGHSESGRWGLAAASVLLSAADPIPTCPTDLAKSLIHLRRVVLRSIDRAMLSGCFNPLVAQHIDFGGRWIAIPEEDQAPSPFSNNVRWTDPMQVDVALRRSWFARLTPHQAMANAKTLPAFLRVLDAWPASPTDPTGAIPPCQRSDFFLSDLLELCEAESRRPVPLGASPEPAPPSPEDLLRVLRDHPRSAASFWADVLSSNNPGERTLLAFEAVAAETPGPGSDAVLAQLANRQAAGRAVPPEIAARAALQLRMRREPAQEMLMP